MQPRVTDAVASPAAKEETMTKPKLVFNPYSQDYFDNPYEIYKRMRDEAPIYYDEQEDFYALTRHADVAAAFKDHDSFSSARGCDLPDGAVSEPPQQSIIFMDPPDHRHMRSLLNKAFTPRADPVPTRDCRRTRRALPGQGRSTQLRRRAGLLRPVPRRGDHPDGRGARGVPATGSALDRQRPGTQARTVRARAKKTCRPTSTRASTTTA